jgi:hypothetical protein
MDILGKIKELAEADGVSLDEKIRILDSERQQRGKTADSYLWDWDDEERRQVNGRQRAVPEQQRRRRQVDVVQHHAAEQQDYHVSWVAGHEFVVKNYDAIFKDCVEEVCDTRAPPTRSL